MQQTTARKHVVFYTAGTSIGNPGPGGWACILKFGEHRKELSGYMPDTTTDRMHLFALISGLGALKEPCQVSVCSDSRYLAEAFERNPAEAWQRSGRKNEDSRAGENGDLWFILCAQMRRHQIRLIPVKNLNADEDGKRCMELAGLAVEEWRLINSPHDEDGELITP